MTIGEKAWGLLMDLWADQNGLEITESRIIKKENEHEQEKNILCFGAAAEDGRSA